MSTRPPYVAEMVPMDMGWDTKWLVSVESDIEGDNYYTGWTTVEADARQHIVHFCGYDMSPLEARNLAEALTQAADHAASYTGDGAQ